MYGDMYVNLFLPHLVPRGFIAFSSSGTIGVREFPDGTGEVHYFPQGASAFLSGAYVAPLSSEAMETARILCFGGRESEVLPFLRQKIGEAATIVAAGQGQRECEKGARAIREAGWFMNRFEAWRKP